MTATELIDTPNFQRYAALVISGEMTLPALRTMYGGKASVGTIEQALNALKAAQTPPQEETRAEIILPLSDDELTRLHELEKEIHDNLYGALRVAECLAEILDKQLYRPHGTMRKYLQMKFPTLAQAYSPRRLEQLAQAGQVIAILKEAQEEKSERTFAFPTAEYQTHPLAPLLKKEPEAIPQLWNEAVSRSNGEVPKTRIVQEVVDEHRETKREQWENELFTNEEPSAAKMNPDWKPEIVYEAPCMPQTSAETSRGYSDGVSMEPPRPAVPKSFAYIEPTTIGRDNRLGGFRFTVIRPGVPQRGLKEQKIHGVMFRDAWLEELGYRLVKINEEAPEEEDAFACITPAPTPAQQREETLGNFFA